MIEKLMKMEEKEIYKWYTIGMALVVVFCLFFLIWTKSISAGIGLGFNIGLWIGFSLRRLIK